MNPIHKPVPGDPTDWKEIDSEPCPHVDARVIALLALHSLLGFIAGFGVCHWIGVR